jgi:hypothetical protein
VFVRSAENLDVLALLFKLLSRLIQTSEPDENLLGNSVWHDKILIFKGVCVEVGIAQSVQQQAVTAAVRILAGAYLYLHNVQTGPGAHWGGVKQTKMSRWWYYTSTFMA